MASNISESLTRKVYNGLIEEIVEGRLHGGERLDDAKIMKLYGVSRTPVREATLLLEKDGFLETVGHKGIFVKTLSVQAVKDIYFVREIMECNAAKLAANRITDDDILILENTLNKMENLAEDQILSGYPRLDMEFHNTIVSICGVELLAHLCSQMSLQRASILLRGENYIGNTTRYNQEHRLILERLAAHDADGVEAAMRSHIQKGKAGVLTQMMNVS